MTIVQVALRGPVDSTTSTLFWIGFVVCPLISIAVHTHPAGDNHLRAFVHNFALFTLPWPGYVLVLLRIRHFRQLGYRYSFAAKMVLSASNIAWSTGPGAMTSYGADAMGLVRAGGITLAWTTSIVAGLLYVHLLSKSEGERRRRGDGKMAIEERLLSRKDSSWAGGDGSDLEYVVNGS